MKRDEFLKKRRFFCLTATPSNMPMIWDEHTQCVNPRYDDWLSLNCGLPCEFWAISAVCPVSIPTLPTCNTGAIVTST